MRDFILKTFTDDEAETCLRCNMQELVRCKDCKHGKIYVGRHGYHVACEIIEHPSHDLDWFCADGDVEREDEDEEEDIQTDEE